MAFSFKFSRYSLIFLNILYLALSFILIGIAAYARLSIYITSIHIVGGIIVCGVFLFVLAVAGLFGAFRHDQAILFFYIVLLFSLFVAQFSVACACLSLTSDTQKSIIEGAWAKSSNDTKIDVMKMFQCCGFQRVDLPPTHPLGHPPCKLASLSCCENSQEKLATCCQGSRNSTLSEVIACPCTLSCWTVIERKLETGVRVTGATSLFFSVIEVVGVWLALRYRHQRDPMIDPNSLL